MRRRCLVTDPTPAGVVVGTVDALATAYGTFDDVPEGVTFDEVGFVGIATMKGVQ